MTSLLHYLLSSAILLYIAKHVRKYSLHQRRIIPELY